MPKLDPDFEIDLTLSLDDADDPTALSALAAKALKTSPTYLPPIEVKKRTIDARRGKVRFVLTVGPIDP